MNRESFYRLNWIAPAINFCPDHFRMRKPDGQVRHTADAHTDVHSTHQRA